VDIGGVDQRTVEIWLGRVARSGDVRRWMAFLRVILSTPSSLSLLWCTTVSLTERTLRRVQVVDDCSHQILKRVGCREVEPDACGEFLDACTDLQQPELECIEVDVA
jgi:hypothetical protein